jgi:hypothetical protein
MKKLLFTLLTCLAFVWVGKAQETYPEKYEIYSAYNEKTGNTTYFYIGYSYVGYSELTAMSTTKPEVIQLKIISSDHTIDGFPTTDDKFKVQSPNGRQVWTIEPKYDGVNFSLTCTYPNGETENFAHEVTLRDHMGNYKDLFEDGTDVYLYFYYAEDGKTLIGSYKNSYMDKYIPLTIGNVKGNSDGNNFLVTSCKAYNPHTKETYDITFVRSFLDLEKRIWTKPSLYYKMDNGTEVPFEWVKK